jgi:outer membrane protein
VNTAGQLSVLLLACAAYAAGAADDGAAVSRTLSLAEAHRIALENHPQIAAADYRALAAHEVFVEARSGLMPQVNLYGSAVDAAAANTRIMAGGLNNPSVFSRTAGGLTVSQLITDFGRTSNLAASSKLRAHAASYNAAATREQVLLEVDQNYFGALQAQAVLSIARQTLDTRQLLLDRISVLAANKLKSELDVSFARVAMQQSRLLLQKSQSDADAALAFLSATLGYSELQHFRLEEESSAPIADTDDVAALIKSALEDRPDLASLRAERDAAQHLARAEREARLPSISVVGAAGGSPSHDVRLPDDYAAGSIQLSVPVFAGGLYRARESEAQLRAKAAAEALRAVEDNVSRDVRVAWLNLTDARQRQRTTEQLRDYAGEAYELADARYRAGSSSIVELSQAQLELTSAQIANANARYDVLIQQSDLNFQLGALTAVDPSALRATDR